MIATVKAALKRDVVMKTLLFGVTLLSAIPFAAALLYARYYHPLIIPALIFLQSTTAFGAFLMQMGLRAGLRKEYVANRVRVVRSTKSVFIQTAFLVSTLCSMGFVLFGDLDLPICFLLIAANAALTLRQGLSVISANWEAATFESLALLAMNAIAAGLLIDDTFPKYIDFILIEATAVLVAWPFYDLRKFKYRCGIAAVVVRKYWGLQVSAFMVLLGMYIFNLIIVQISFEDAEIGKEYALMTIVANSIILVVGKIFLIGEREIIRREKTQVVLFYLLVGLGAVSIASTAFERPTALIGLIMSLQIFGSYIFSNISHFILERYRKRILIVSMVIPAHGTLVLLLSDYQRFNWTPFYVNFFMISMLTLMGCWLSKQQVFIKFKNP